MGFQHACMHTRTRVSETVQVSLPVSSVARLFTGKMTTPSRPAVLSSSVPSSPSSPAVEFSSFPQAPSSLPHDQSSAPLCPSPTPSTPGVKTKPIKRFFWTVKTELELLKQVRTQDRPFRRASPAWECVADALGTVTDGRPSARNCQEHAVLMCKDHRKKNNVSKKR